MADVVEREGLGDASSREHDICRRTCMLKVPSQDALFFYSPKHGAALGSNRGRFSTNKEKSNSNKTSLVVT
jgi:hypothetical protein